MSVLFAIESLTAGYEGKIVLSDVSMIVQENDFIGIIGPNGGGKTTLLKVILGLLQPLSGKVDYSPGNLRLNQIGYMPQVAQGDTLFPVTVEDVVLSGMMHNRGPTGRMGRAEKKHAAEVMDELGLSPLAHQALNELSGGQLQRVYLAR
ncbi:MAG TPA: ATP-binding cassette domain-containing protein, partial [Bacteroidales bacterium]|nr:ATP-binding cassette domain-containing protein [Bacteroidales bacterium]